MVFRRVVGVVVVAGGLALTLAGGLVAPASGANPIAQGTENCRVLYQFDDGSRLFLCPPGSSPPGPTKEPPPLETSKPPQDSTPTVDPQPSATEIAYPGDPYPGAPLCTDHDPKEYHTLWNAEQGCHYDHQHGDNPHSVDDIFGKGIYTWASGSISYPWQTINSETGCLEDDCKHSGYMWLVRRDQPCESAYTDGCVVAFRALIHGMSSSNAAAVRYHSAWLEAKVCREDQPEICGVLRAGGWQDTGDLFIDGQRVIDVPDNNNRQKLHYFRTGNDHFGTWYGGSPGGEGQRGGMWQVAVEFGDLWGPINPSDPTQLQFFCEAPNDHCAQNGSRYQPHVVGVQFPPRFRQVLDPDGDGIVDYHGFTNRWGEPVEGCSAIGLDCVPLMIDGIPINYQYQGRFDYREYDIMFNGQTSGWLQFPGYSRP